MVCLSNVRSALFCFCSLPLLLLFLISSALPPPTPSNLLPPPPSSLTLLRLIPLLFPPCRLSPSFTITMFLPQGYHYQYLRLFLPSQYLYCPSSSSFITYSVFLFPSPALIFLLFPFLLHHHHTSSLLVSVSLSVTAFCLSSVYNFLHVSPPVPSPSPPASSAAIPPPAAVIRPRQEVSRGSIV